MAKKKAEAKPAKLSREEVLLARIVGDGPEAEAYWRAKVEQVIAVLERVARKGLGASRDDLAGAAIEIMEAQGGMPKIFRRPGTISPESGGN
jgi:hypothetical protein